MMNNQHCKSRRILIFSLHYDRFIGGAEIFVQELVSRLNHEFTIITRMGPEKLQAEERKDNVTLIRVGGSARDKYFYPLLAYRKALSMHKERPFDIAYSILENHAGLAGMFFKRKTGIPFMLNLGMGHTDALIRRKTFLIYPLYRRIYTSADRIHAVSSFLRDRAIRLGAQENRIRVIPNGVDLIQFNRNRYSLKALSERKKVMGLDGRTVLVTSSRLSRTRGVEDVIRAMKMLEDRYPKLVFLVLGTGELEKRLKEVTRALGLEKRVFFHGFVAHTELPEYLCMSDLFIRPSLIEGHPISFIEAMACRLPVIATPVGGIPDFIEDRKTGIICEPENPESIAKAIEAALTEDTKKMVDAAYALVRDRYDWRTIMEAIDNLFCEFSSPN